MSSASKVQTGGTVCADAIPTEVPVFSKSTSEELRFAAQSAGKQDSGVVPSGFADLVVAIAKCVAA